MSVDKTRSEFSPWLLATRPKTLTAAVVPVLVGTVAAELQKGRVKLALSLFALLSAIFIQIGTNLVNDAIDFKKGADTETRIGPQRVTQSGLLTPRQVMLGAFLCFGLAIAFGLPLVFAGGWTIVAVGCLSLVFAYGYTGGPFPLAYLGLGDLFVLIFFGWVAVGGVAWLQSGNLTFATGVIATQIGLLATVLIAINNLRDREQDLRVGKRTLAVLLGLQASRMEIAFLCLMPFILNFYWWGYGARWAAGLPFLIFPLALRLVILIFQTPPGPAYNRYLGMAAGLHLIFGILWAAGCLV